MMASRPTIGLLIGRLDERYQANVWPGVADVAQERDANLICFAGRSFRSPYSFEAQRTVIYDLVSAKNVDGLIIMSGTVGHFLSPEEIETFCDHYQLPAVSIAVAVPGIPSVVIENEEGFRAALTHLVDHHGYRRIAFIRGTESHPEAEARYQTYLEVMGEHHIPIDPQLVAPGDFVAETGVRAVELLLDERKIELEAIAAANDDMALGAMNALQARGLGVPDDVAVTGFDDVEESRYVTPPLTTVRQPLYEQGRLAAEMVLALMEGEPVPARRTLPTELVVRQSCGCLTRTIRPTPPAEADADSAEAAFAARREHILNEMVDALGKPVSSRQRDQLDELLDAFATELDDPTVNAFLPALDHLLRRVAPEGDVAAWQKAMYVLNQRILPLLADDETRIRIETLCQKAHTLIGETLQRSEVHKRLQTERRAFLFSGISQQLMTTFDVDNLVEIVVENLPQLGIQTCYIALYEGSATPAERSRLILGYRNGQRIELGEEKSRFRTQALVPQGLRPVESRYALALEPLHFRKAHFGYILYDLLRERIVYQVLSSQIGTALQGALLSEERARAEVHLAEKAQELARSNEELEQFAHIVSHDLQEPLRMVTSYLQLLEQRYKGQLDEDADDFINFAVDGAERMRTMIEDLLAYSRVGTRGKPFQPTDTDVALDQALANLQIAIEESNAEITGDDLPTVTADESQLIQLFQNLIGNAIKFQKEDASPRIHVDAERVGDMWHFSVADNGIGIDSDDAERIFQIFRRLHSREEYEGTGIGLAVCKRIVERHGGRIWVESEPGEGSTFFFTIPAGKEAPT